MKKLLSGIGIVLILASASCSHSRKDMLVRRWQEDSINNNQMQTALIQQRAFMDSVGRHTTPAENQELYGTQNMDSLREYLAADMTNYYRKQNLVLAETWFEFRADSSVILHSDEGLDSAKWYFDDDKNLVLDEMAMKGAGTKMIMQVQALSDTALVMKFTEGNATSIMHFIPAKK